MKKIFLTIILSLTLLPVFSNAQTDTYKLLEPVPCIAGVGDCTPGTMQTEIDINSYILYIYKFSIAIAVFLAIVMIIWGGFLYITSETPFKIADGREKITNAVLGLVMVLVSYLILLTIDPRLVNIDTELPKIAPLTAEQIQALRQFESIVITDLNNLGVNKQKEVADATQKIRDLQQQKTDVLTKLSNNEITAEEAEVEIAKIDQGIKDSTTVKNVIVTESNGLSLFTRGLGYIDNSVDFLDEADRANLAEYTAEPIANTTGNTPRPTNSKNIIQNTFNQQINELLKTNTNGDKIQLLEKQRDFYIQQIKEESYVSTDIYYYNNGATGKTDLKKKIDQYKKDILDPKKLTDSGVSADIYNQILKARVLKIEEAIK